jgi:2-C-methyl-D-erythritol 4-phosphate cytidylyltransferase
VWAIVVAGGGGDRYGAPKQYESLGAARVVDLALAAAAERCDGVVAVVPADRVHEPLAADAVTGGGGTRSASVRAGLALVPTAAAIVVVHDAARPLAPAAVFDRVIEAVRRGADAAVPGLAVPDTLKRVDGTGRVTATVSRDGLVAVQTPQAFAAEMLRRAHAGGGDATDDAGLVEALGGSVVVVNGDRLAAKVTDPHDLAVLRAMLDAGVEP